MRPAVYLHPKTQTMVNKGHPWVFPKGILKHKGTPVTGELIDLYTQEGILLGVGVYNEHSLYCVRVLAQAEEAKHAESFASLLHYRLQQALQLRERMLLPNAATSAYRVCNSEGDGLSGLTLDRFNRCSVIASSAYWVEKQQATVREVIQSLLPQDDILWLSQAKPLAQDGWKAPLQAPPQGEQVVVEAGIRYQVDFSTTQKTGLFLDQRDNHQRMASFAKGKRVLDLYTYTGGFALHAAKAGAKQVTAVDSSESAIALAKSNAERNGITSIDFIVGDARDYLACAGEYEMIILDPPKLVPSQRHLHKAKNYYRFLHQALFAKMRSGTLLMTCNCSSALLTTEFCELVGAQARAVGKTARQLGVYGPASCHPTLAVFPEGHYLTAVLVAVI